MGKRRDNRKAAKHQHKDEDYIEFVAPEHNHPFYFNTKTGSNSWETPPSGATIRKATTTEQKMYEDQNGNTAQANAHAAETTTTVLSEKRQKTSSGWVWRSYGIMDGRYWYNASLGSTWKPPSCHESGWTVSNTDYRRSPKVSSRAKTLRYSIQLEPKR